MRNPLQRYYGRGDLHFLTFSCYRRWPLLGTARSRTCFVNILNQVRSAHKFLLLGYVVMPEHVHLLITEPPDGNPSKSLQVLKQRVSRTLRGRKRKSSAQQLSLPFRSGFYPAAFWQRRFYDFNVWSEKKLREKLEYMHRNPLQRKLVTHLKDWPWSSWAYYAKGETGLIRIDCLNKNSTGAQATILKRQEPHPLQKPQRVRHPKQLRP